MSFVVKCLLYGTFINEAAEDFSETPSFRCKFSWKPPQGNASLKLFLSQIERELFEIPKKRLGKILKRKGKITEKELKYFIINHKKLPT